MVVGSAVVGPHGDNGHQASDDKASISALVGEQAGMPGSPSQYTSMYTQRAVRGIRSKGFAKGGGKGVRGSKPNMF